MAFKDDSLLQMPRIFQCVFATCIGLLNWQTSAAPSSQLPQRPFYRSTAFPNHKEYLAGTRNISLHFLLPSTRNISLQRQSNYASTSSDFADIVLSSSDTIILYPWGDFDSIAHECLRHCPPSITACTDVIVPTRRLSQSVISTPPHCNRVISTPLVHQENLTAKSAQILRRFFH